MLYLNSVYIYIVPAGGYHVATVAQSGQTQPNIGPFVCP